jgi:hypothetical protein
MEERPEDPNPRMFLLGFQYRLWAIDDYKSIAIP